MGDLRNGQEKRHQLSGEGLALLLHVAERGLQLCGSLHQVNSQNRHAPTSQMSEMRWSSSEASYRKMSTYQCWNSK